MTDDSRDWWPRFARRCAQLSVAAFALVAVVVALFMIPTFWAVAGTAFWLFQLTVAIFVVVPPIGVILALLGIRRARRLGTIGLIGNGLWIFLLLSLPLLNIQL